MTSPSEKLVCRSFTCGSLNSVDVAQRLKLRDDVLRQIIHLKLGKIRRRFAANYKAKFEVDDAVIQSVLDRCREVESGARNIDKILSNTLLPELSAVVLGRMAEGRPIQGVRISIAEGGGFRYDL